MNNWFNFFEPRIIGSFQELVEKFIARFKVKKSYEPTSHSEGERRDSSKIYHSINNLDEKIAITTLIKGV